MSFSVYLRQSAANRFVIRLGDIVASTSTINGYFSLTEVTTVTNTINGYFDIYVTPVVVVVVRDTNTALSLSRLSSEIINNYDLDDFTVGGLNFWIRSNISRLNNYLSTKYYITSEGYISPVISDNDKVILFKIFEEYYYNKLAKDATGASNYSVSTEVSENNNFVKLINRTEIHKTYSRLARQSKKELNNLINVRTTFEGLAVHGDDN